MRSIYPTDTFEQHEGTFKEITNTIKRRYPNARPDYQATDNFIGYDYWSDKDYVAMCFCKHPGQWICIMRSY